MIRDAEALLAQIRAIHETIRDTVVAATEQQAIEELSAAVGDEAGDTIYAIDRVSEAALLDQFGRVAERWPCVLVAEGLGETGVLVLPLGSDATAAEVTIIVDPIDGTRGLMHQKRSAWILTGVAAGTHGTLADIELAVMTEIPLVKQHLCDTLWALAGQGAHGERYNRITGARTVLTLRPSRATSIAQGFGGLARFFPGIRAELAAIDDTVVAAVLGEQPAGRALAFEDQYISTGGQLYELIIGHDRWVADLRALFGPWLTAQGKPPILCCHPYDLCSELVAREAGVIVTDGAGAWLAAPLDVTTDCAWAGFANAALHAQVWPALSAELRARGVVG